MSWRFRKSFKILPGVKLNLTPYGLSATIGASPVSLNVGPRGTYANVGIPGTGIWNRVGLDEHSSPESYRQSPPINEQPAVPSRQPLPVLPPKWDNAEIRSAGTEQLSSASMDGLRKLLKDAHEERSALQSEISSAAGEANRAIGRYRGWQRGFLLKRIFRKSFSARKEALETQKARLEELQEQLRLTAVATQIDIDPELAHLYYKMRDDFAALTNCAKIWDTLTRRMVNRVAERSAASEQVTREPVHISLNSCELITWEQKVPHLPNINGGDLYLYPGFLLYRASREAFALIDAREVRITYQCQRFIEDQSVPTDSQVVDRAWARSNKDGSPDRRFRDNHQIPVVAYGMLTFTSPSGLREEFQFSNPELAQRFWKSWQLFWAELAVDKPRPSEVTVDSDGRVTQTIKGAVYRDAPLDFVCPGCAHEFHETFAWLVKNTSVLCPGCNDTINLHFDQREALGGIYGFSDEEFDVTDK